jgi:hypothetical protein
MVMGRPLCACWQLGKVPGKPTRVLGSTAALMLRGQFWDSPLDEDLQSQVYNTVRVSHGGVRERCRDTLLLLVCKQEAEGTPSDWDQPWHPPAKASGTDIADVTASDAFFIFFYCGVGYRTLASLRKCVRA